MAVNNVVLVGRLTNEVAVKTIGEENVKQAKFTLAVDRDFKRKGADRPDTDFIKVEATRATADFVEKYFTKGKQVSVVGSIRTYSYEKDGKTIYDFSVTAKQVGFADSVGGGTGGQNGGNSNNNQGGFDAPEGFDFMPTDGDDLPFGPR